MDFVECPLCNTEHHIINYFIHLRNEHPETLATIASLMMPTSTDDNILNMIYDYNNMVFQEDDTYEDLSDLCDRIGKVYIGVKDIDEVAPATIFVKNKNNEETKCPVCFEEFKNIEKKSDNFIRKINLCKHKFCSECITTWLEKHKSCPICKIELEE